jgi:membrane protein YqaA with SNARE-associated domain
MPLTRGWKQFFLVAGSLSLIAGIVAVALPSYRNLAFLFFYSIPSNSVIPVPHEPAIILLGKYYPPVLVAFVAVLGTMLACFLDYKTIKYAFSNARVSKIRESDVYKGAVHYFLKAPFFAILVAALAPFIPFYIFRVLSPSSGYPFKRYVVAVFFGRLPRYYLFALLGTSLSIPSLVMVGGGIFFLCIYLGTRVKRHLAANPRQIIQSLPKPPEIPMEEIQLEEVGSRA